MEDAVGNPEKDLVIEPQKQITLTIGEAVALVCAHEIGEFG